MASNTNDLFNSHEMKEGGVQSINPTIGVWDIFGMMWATTSIIQDFDELYIGGIWQVGFLSGPYH